MSDKKIIFFKNKFSISQYFSNALEEYWSENVTDKFNNALNDNNRNKCGTGSDFLENITNRPYSNVQSLQTVADRYECDIIFSDIWHNSLRDICKYDENYWWYCDELCEFGYQDSCL